MTMDFYYDTGYRAVQWVQNFQNPIFDYLFIGISALGVKEFYLLAIPLVYWCVDKRLGAGLYFILLFGVVLNTWVKVFVHTDRPDSSRVRVLFAESGGGYSFPSGHAQGAVAFWGLCMLWARKLWFSAACVVLLLVMGVSRLYLGLHFPWDVLGGALLGIASLVIFFILLSWYNRIKSAVPWGVWLGGVVVFAAGMILLLPWNLSGFVGGGFLGFYTGALLEKRFVGFAVRGNAGVQTGKVLLGLGVGIAIFLAAALLAARGISGHLPGYTLLGIWTSLGAPWCFKKLGWG